MFIIACNITKSQNFFIIKTLGEAGIQQVRSRKTFASVAMTTFVFNTKAVPDNSARGPFPVLQYVMEK